MGKDSFKMKAAGFGQLDKNLRKIVMSVNSTHEGIGQAMLRAVEETVVPVAQGYAHSQFDTEGDLPDAIKAVLVNQYQVDIGVYAPHGAVHEYGGTFEITDKQRNFFWYKYSTTEDEMWKALALSDSYTIPARPYVRPAIDEAMDEAISLAGDYLYLYWLKAVGFVPLIKAVATGKAPERPNIKGGFCK